ncbi:fibrillin-3-like, partial [Rhagoletis pomonella]|uniref:fibrillin-3-like n=1 Tax=Rhagoletis pomonella TaxID=28610 RepID=UPI0017811B28
FRGCTDIDECTALEKPCGTYAICENAAPGYNCKCPQGFDGKPDPKVACEQVDVNILCRSSFDCTNNAECIENQCFCLDGFEPIGSSCVDIDECRTHADACGAHAQCINTPGSFRCDCEAGFVGTPPRIGCKEPCEDVHCGEHAYCKPDGNEAYCICEDGWTFNPSDISAGCIDIDECDTVHGPYGSCGVNATCTNTLGSFSCTCPSGFSGDPHAKCVDVDECRVGSKCGEGAECVNMNGGYTCRCPADSIADPDPTVRCVPIVTCAVDKDCPGNAICDAEKRCLCPQPNIGNDCRHPCEAVNCGSHAQCMLANGQAQCLCVEGYTGSPNTPGGCNDIDECKANPCQANAICTNTPGGYLCQCPSGTSGDPYREGCTAGKVAFTCSDSNPCSPGETCVTDSYTGNGVCICRQGYERNAETGQCQDVDECSPSRQKAACGLNALCKNLPGSYECKCPQGFSGNPFVMCEQCKSPECQCQPPYKLVGNSCILADCSTDKKCPGGAECISIAGGVSYCACPKGYKTGPDGSCIDVDECVERDAQVCAFGAECINIPGGFTCACPDGYNGDPYHGLCAPAQRKCAADKECGTNEKCVQPGECVCPPPFFLDPYDNNKCKSPCERFPCGINAKCTPTDPPQCMCEPGFKGDPLMGCTDEDECAHLPCAYGAYCVNKKGGYQCVCPKGFTGDPYKSGCILETGVPKSTCTSNEDCASNLACVEGTCVSPCSSLLCGPNAFCETENHAGWCRCRVGYSKDPNGDCVSQCKDIICGGGALCIPTSDGPTCKCPQGYFGNPFPGGSCTTDQCSASRPCAGRQVCINGRCKERCDGVVCGTGATCDKSSGKCVCEPNFIGNPDLVCVPPVKNAECEPKCGENAHCEYGFGNSVCACNPGTTGNPYEGCGPQSKNICAPNSCGPNAECRSDGQQISCICPQGFTGNAYVGCQDVDECVNKPCGLNAACLNSNGGFECLCLSGFAGDPFSSCQPVDSVFCSDAERCECSARVECPDGFTCESGRCKNLCSKTACGPRAVCDGGKCICPLGYIGDPHDTNTGCTIRGQCNNDGDCKHSEICFQLGKGLRKCVDACSKIQCGPNALCVSNDHRSSCICTDGYFGNPSNLQVGCQPERKVPDIEDKCKTDNDCEAGFSCAPDMQGTRECINRCTKVVCGTNEVCNIDANGHALCNCADSFVWNPVTSSCEKPTLPDCTSDKDCPTAAACRPDVVGVLKCVSLCDEFTCPANSVCVARNHQGRCDCLSGFVGNPNDRNGCQPVVKNQCRTNAECAESEACIKYGPSESLTCRPACESVKCGPRAVCITNNHLAQCQCPPGPYAGDPNDPFNGCQSVPCVYNHDCPPTKMCNRMTHTCYDVCDEESCGENAICIAEDHRAVCQCPPGFKGNPMPEVECTKISGCLAGTCHHSAICEVTPSGPICRCPENFIGDPETTGCRPDSQCPNGDADCPVNTICAGGRCIDPCDNACGQNAECKVVNRKPVCSCPLKFQQSGESPKEGCVRSVSRCRSDIDCGGEICYNGQCRVACRNADDCSTGEKCLNNICVIPCLDHSQCTSGLACLEGLCVIGCRSNKDCSADQSCINNKCDDPCKTGGICGPNALCSIDKHLSQCTCPEGFEGNPTADQGCVRVPAPCLATNQCPNGHMCIGNQCNLPCQKNSVCAIGERCYQNVCRKVCYTSNNCLPGEICNNDGTCQPGCDSDADCPPTELCLSGKCKCASGFIGTPFGCSDIDECTEEPCHLTARCENIPGSYRCICPDGTVGDGLSQQGCIAPKECYRDQDCANNLSCVNDKCTEPCTNTTCGPHALCIAENHQAACDCPPGHLGDPSEHTVGCFKVECIVNEDCASDKACDSETNRCIKPCDLISCGKGTCNVANHEALCSCYEGYQLVNGECEDIDECLSKPCHSTAMCQNHPGSYQCLCREGLIGDPINVGCRDPNECLTDSDCPSSASCQNSRCRSPCERENACGRNATCSAQSHNAICTCPSNARGDPSIECVYIECSDNEDCANEKACLESKCVDPCTLPNVCGANARCTAQNHIGVCTCETGTTGDAQLGCVALQYCNTDSQCASGTICTNGICATLCSSVRDCISDQLCIQGVCQPTCRTNSSCPEFQYCLNNICTKEVLCGNDDDCDVNENCIQDNYGRASCENVCLGRAICGRNAECIARSHAPDCECKEGFFGDPKSGCRKIECNTDAECSHDKTCDNHMCKIACLIGEPCGDNALCTTENHKQICHCQPGYTGDPSVRCDVIDFCNDAPCGPGARCRNSRGSFKCTCPPGLVGDPYNEGCRTAVECETSDDCPPHAECTKINGITKCQDVCANVKCGTNAECIPKGHQAHCACRNGYDDNPADRVTGCKPLPVPCQMTSDCSTNTYCSDSICKPACILDTECGSSEVCQGGQCINPCLQAQACGMNAECHIQTHYKQCSCPAGFTGNPDVECVRIPVACASDAECHDGYNCHDSMCQPACQNDQDCALNEKCLRGSCMLTCRVDNDCFLGHVCLHNKCVYGCRTDDDCSASESCRQDKCTNPCLENPCGPNAACSVSNHRAICSCLDGMVPSPTPQVGCVRSPPLGCNENRDCANGLACFEFACRPLCADNAGCLSNERCQGGVCKPLCRRDDDCRNSEVCLGLTCVAGCRSDQGCPHELSCVNQQCVNPCAEPAACGTNAECLVIDHHKQCECPQGLVGNAEVSCKTPRIACTHNEDCGGTQLCYGGSCQGKCRNDQNCLADERCMRGTCRTVCNTDSACAQGQICENRVCQIGCRNDLTCPSDEACINKKCKNPCDAPGQCGQCANCLVVNHGVQCSCPNGFLGDGLSGCQQPPQRCNPSCQCDETNTYCADSCTHSDDCACGQVCARGKCRQKCSAGRNCPLGQLCERGTCLAGCKTNSDCPTDQSCLSGKCADPCADKSACGRNALCTVSDHRMLCYCPDGYEGEPSKECVQFECAQDADCEPNKRCDAGKCRNPCLEYGACGVNAQCRVVDRKPQCSCPPDYFGSPETECRPLDGGCANHPCGANSKCTEVPGGYECACLDGCMGDAHKGCVCEGHLVNACAEQPCGQNSACRVLDHNEAQCYCPEESPYGDAYVQCYLTPPQEDCRTQGCITGECIRKGVDYVCRHDTEQCTSDVECPSEKSCLQGHCVDPCSVRGVCGANALCKSVLHRPRCSCPSCYIGRPEVECKPDPKCTDVTALQPRDPQQQIPCTQDSDCPDTLQCSHYGQCADPCQNPLFICGGSKKCETRRHQPVCVCKSGFIVNEYGELTCAPEKRECYRDDDCASNMACSEGKCRSPCVVPVGRQPICAENKSCEVQDHKPVCICMKDCQPSISICLRDAGCPSGLACRSYQCVNPCDFATCAPNSPCIVEDHKPICKFCPPGFIADAKNGCQKGKAYV